ncbi:MAG: glycosyltransferase, partial [Erysipelotrichaceae bacterium]
MSKGTILYVGGFELPDKNAAAHRVINNAKIFKELGYKVVFIDIDRSLLFDPSSIVFKKEVYGFDCWSIGYPKKIWDWINYLSNIEYIKNIFSKYNETNIIIAYNFPSISLNKLIKFSKRNKTKLISDCTEWYSIKGTNIVFKIIKGLDSFYRMRIVQKKSHGLIVISNYLKKYYLGSTTVIKIPPLVDLSESKWSYKKDTLDNVDKKKLRIVFTGSPSKNKEKLVNIIEALYQLRKYENYNLLILGISKIDFLKENIDFNEKLKSLGERISFRGRVTHEESIKELVKADFSIFIRDKNRLTNAGFPTKFVESITCSTPVITSESSDLADYYKESNLGVLIKNSSVNELKMTLESIFKNQNMFNKSSYKFDNYMF